jgi:septum formation inhibitor MinC
MIAVEHAAEVLPVPAPSPVPAAILRGTARGLEIVVTAGAQLADLTAAIEARLAEAPGFFRGSDVRVRLEGGGKLPAGGLAALETIAAAYDLAIVEIGPVKQTRTPLVSIASATADAVPEDAPAFAAGSAPAASPPRTFEEEVTTQGPAPNLKIDAPIIEEVSAAPEPEPELVKVVVGPVRSGVVLEHPGHVIVFGDVNPGAEVRAIGHIVVLGRLRGTAHAGIGGTDSFIMAHRLEPQQLRIGRRVTRAGEGERPGTEPEMAHVVADQITVERFTGKLPRNLAASLL